MWCMTSTSSEHHGIIGNNFETALQLFIFFPITDLELVVCPTGSSITLLGMKPKTKLAFAMAQGACKIALPTLDRIQNLQRPFTLRLFNVLPAKSNDV